MNSISGWISAGSRSRTFTNSAYSKNPAQTSTRAAIDAGYAAGSRLLREVKVFEELARTALCEPKDLFDAKGNMLALNEMPEDIRRAIASCDVEVTTEVVNSGARGPGVVKVRTTKVKFWDKLRAIDQIAKLAGYQKTESTVGGEYILRWADE
jgi:hypothetical protein